MLTEGIGKLGTSDKGVGIGEGVTTTEDPAATTSSYEGGGAEGTETKTIFQIQYITYYKRLTNSKFFISIH